MPSPAVGLVGANTNQVPKLNPYEVGKSLGRPAPCCELDCQNDRLGTNKWDSNIVERHLRVPGGIDVDRHRQIRGFQKGQDAAVNTPRTVIPVEVTFILTMTDGGSCGRRSRNYEEPVPSA